MERITKTGVVANGVEYKVDCIVFATSFEVGTEWTRRAGYDVIGIDGVTLSDYWADGMKTYHFGEGGAEGFGAGAYTPGINAFNALMAKWREKGDLEGLELG